VSIPAAIGRRASEDHEREFRMLIDGAWVAAESGETFSCVDPFTEEPWGRVPVAGAGAVDRAVRAARRAFDEGGWPHTPAADRAALLRRLAALIETHAEELAVRQIRENGKLASEMVRDEERHADWFESQLDAIERVGINQYLAQQIEPGYSE